MMMNTVRTGAQCRDTGCCAGIPGTSSGRSPYTEAVAIRASGEPTRNVTAVKVAIKHLTPNDRAQLIAWILLYHQDDGAMFSPQFIAKSSMEIELLPFASTSN